MDKIIFDEENFYAVAFLPNEKPQKSVWTFLDEEEGEIIFSMMKEQKSALICISADWNRDLSPWKAKKVFHGGEDFSGGGDSFLQKLDEIIIPTVENRLDITKCKRIILGYSLAGLFALYSFYKTDLFESGASVSGSLWFDGFTDFMEKNEMVKKPLKFYFSLGDREKNTKNIRMATVESETEKAENILKSRNIDTVFVLGSGGHFSETEERIQRALEWLCQV